MFIRYRISWLQMKFPIYFLMDDIWGIFYLVLHNDLVLYCWVISISDLFMYCMLYMCVRGCTRLCMSVWRPEVYVRDLLQSLFLIFLRQGLSLNLKLTNLFRLAEWWVPEFAYPVLCPAVPSFYVGAGDPDSSSHACMGEHFLTENLHK